MSTIASLNVLLSASTAAFSSGLKKGQKDLKGFTSNVSSQLRGLTGLISGFSVGHFITSSLGEFEDAAKGVRKLEAVLNSTGHAAGRTSLEIQQSASRLQELTGVADDSTIAASTLLATFTNIKGDNFDAATKSALDMAAVLGDLNSAAMQVGKALNDPVKGITALSRAGVSFSADQKELIKSLVESGKVADAQRVILGELSREFGGAAAAAKTTADTIRNSWADLKEAFGGLISPAVSLQLQKIASTLKALNPATGEAAGMAIEARLERLGLDPGKAAIRDALKQNSRDTQSAFAEMTRANKSMAADRFDIFNVGEMSMERIAFRATQDFEAERASLTAMLRNVRPDFGEFLTTSLAKGIKAFEPWKQTGMSAFDAISEGAKQTIEGIESVAGRMEELGADLRSRIQADANAIIQANRTPLEQLEEDLRHLSFLFKQGALPAGIALRERDRLLGQFDEPFDSRPGAAFAGTEAAYDAITRHANPKPQRERLWEQMLEEQKRQTNTTESLRRTCDGIERSLKVFQGWADPKKPRL